MRAAEAETSPEATEGEEIKLTFSQQRDKENERISRSRGAEGRGERFQRRGGKLQRGIRGRGRGLVSSGRWQDMEGMLSRK